MDAATLTQRLVERFESLSAQHRLAARYLLDNTHDVALLSMREQARQAGVQPATMTRLAKQLGFEGYEQIRTIYQAALRDGDIGFSPHATGAKRNLRGDKALASRMVDSLVSQIKALKEGDQLEQLSAAAQALAGARRVYCLSLRSIHPAGWYLHYILSLVGERAILLDGIAGTAADGLARATAADVLFVATVEPYTRLTVDTAKAAAERGLSVIAVTDSPVSPLARLATHVIPIPTASPGPFRTMSPAFVVAELLSAMVVTRGGKEALKGLRQMDEHLAALGTHIRMRPG